MNLRYHSFEDNDELCPAPARDDRYCAAGDEAWSQTVSLLEKLYARPPVEGSRGCRTSSQPDAGPAELKACEAEWHRRASNVKTARAAITVIERVSPVCVVLRWCSYFCHYGNQTWSRQVARISGVCAVTGQHINRGDAVFRPKDRRRSTPANADAMIHPSAFD